MMGKESVIENIVTLILASKLGFLLKPKVSVKVSGGSTRAYD